MSRYNKKDHYYHKAKSEGFLARSAYKLQEIQKKFRVLPRGGRVLDLGCAPGAWSQVALPMIGAGGRLVGVDLEAVTLTAPNARFLQRDAFAMKAPDFPEAPFDCVLSDMAPKTSGIKVRDQALSAELCLHALALAEAVLKPGGNLVVKLFEGEDAESVKRTIRARFQDLKLFRPESTRQASFEIYLVALGFKGAAPSPCPQTPPPCSSP
ncbi:MAG: RlmE family RNA methyltransferase [Bdellovibrionales bacterium]|nr:RlmE family RNA methyltransferase [Bdellovibrionales bacterium]